MWRTVRPPHSEHAAAAPGSQSAVPQALSPFPIQPPTEAHPPPHLPRPDLEQAVRGGAPGAQAAQWARPCARGADLRHGSASQHLAFWPFDGPEGLLERLRSATARPGRLWYASAWLGAVLGMTDPCPSARRATARRRDCRRGPSGLTPAWPGSRCVLASPDARSRRSRRPARAPPDPSASTAARTRAALSAPLSPLTRAVLPWADASSRPAGEPPRARRRRPQLLQRPLMASRAFPGRPGDRRWAAVHRRGSHARLATPCAI